MSALLEEDEVEFLQETEELLSDYVNSDVIFETIMVCTKKQLGRSNYLKKFNDVFKCIRRKMFQLSQTTERSLEGGIIQDPESHITFPGIIDLRVIMKAFLNGYKILKPRLEQIAEISDVDLRNLGNKKDLGVALILTILARANLDNRFTS